MKHDLDPLLRDRTTEVNELEKERFAATAERAKYDAVKRLAAIVDRLVWLLRNSSKECGS